MHVTGRFALSLATLVLVAAACSSGGTPAGATAPAGGTAAPAGGAGSIPCDKLSPIVAQVTGFEVASTDPEPNDCTFNVNTPGDTTALGLAGIVSIRQESADPNDWDSVIKVLIPDSAGKDISGVGDRARETTDGSLLYAVHNGKVFAVQQELIGGNSDVPGDASKLMLALFQFV
jgi:hypothetical protein